MIVIGNSLADLRFGWLIVLLILSFRRRCLHRKGGLYMEEVDYCKI